MDIRTLYLSETRVTTSTLHADSDIMFELIKNNRVKELLTFFQTTHRGQLINLVNEPNANYKNMLPINFAIMCSANHLILVILLRLGARYDDSNNSPLIMAVRSGLMNLVKILVVSGADVNALDENGYSILHWACFKRNTLMVRLILKLTDFTFYNHDRNLKRLTPLGISVELENLELVKELLKCKNVDPNVIDTKTKRYVYDLAAEYNQLRICLEMESAFKRSKNKKYSRKKATKKYFHDLHDYTVEGVVHHQIRSQWLMVFVDDPRGAYQPLDDPTLRLPFLPDNKNWKLIDGKVNSSSNSGWTCSFLTNEQRNPVMVSFSGKSLIETGTLFSNLDNYRCRILARVHKNKK